MSTKLKTYNSFSFLKMSSLFIYCLLLLQLVESLNLDSQFPLIYEDPQKELSSRSTYFGYKVILYSREEISWIQISAPRANDSKNPDIVEPGLIYRCNIGENCNSIIYDYEDSEDESDDQKEYYDKKDQQWLGGSMIINPETGLIAVCAPRWVNRVMNEEWLMQGAVYTSSANGNENITSKYIPLIDEGEQVIKTDDSLKYYNYGMGQAGISAHFSKYKKNESVQLILGAPGINNWHGSVVLYEGDQKLPNIVSKRSIIKDIDINIDSGGGIKNRRVVDSNKAVRNSDYFGYGVAIGRFYSNETLYAASAPKASYNRGYVLIFRVDNKNKIEELQRLFNSRKEVGGYFGANIEVADLNNDGYDDLLVSAPMLKIPTVFIFIGGMNSLSSPKIGLDELKVGGIFDRNSQFGSSIAVADLDLDGYKDILIGGPFAENGKGAIALWKGGPLGPEGNGPPTVIYRASNIHPNLRGFGISIAPPIDIDQNLYPDVAIGSFLSGHVVIFRGRPTIQFQVKIEPPTEKLLYYSKNFTLAYCVNYESKFDLKTAISVRLNVSVEYTIIDDVTKEKPPKDYSFIVDKVYNVFSNCDKLENFFREGIADSVQSIRVNISATLIDYTNKTETILISKENEKDEDQFNNKYPLAYMASDKIDIPIETDCGNETCKTDLKISAYIIGLNDTFIVGSNKTIQLNITVENKGQSSYFTKVRIYLPSSTKIARLIHLCYDEGFNNLLSKQIITCDLANPLKPNATKSLTIPVNMEDVLMERRGDFLAFGVEALTESKEENEFDNMSEFLLFLDVEAFIAIIGHSPEEYSYEEIDGEVPKEPISFLQMYEVQKSGISPVDIVMLQVRIPYSYMTKNGEVKFVQIGKPKGEMESDTFRCNENPHFEELVEDDLVLKKREERDAEDLIRKKRNSVKVKSVKSESSEINEKLVMGSEYNSTVEFLPANRTVRISCDDENVMCTEAVCEIKLSRKPNVRSRLYIYMKVSISETKHSILGEKDILVITTEGTAKISNIKLESFDSTTISTIFKGSLPEYKVPMWVIILCLILGLLLLVLLISGLMKVGFFEREKKKQLQSLINAEQQPSYFVVSS